MGIAGIFLVTPVLTSLKHNARSHTRAASVDAQAIPLEAQLSMSQCAASSVEDVLRCTAKTASQASHARGELRSCGRPALRLHAVKRCYERTLKWCDDRNHGSCAPQMPTFLVGGIHRLSLYTLSPTFQSFTCEF